MSSDFLEDIDDDHQGNCVLLSMNAHTHAFLTILSEEDSIHYCLPPDEVGWRNAQKIVDALNCWIEHSKRIAEMGKE